VVKWQAYSLKNVNPVVKLRNKKCE